ncbi:hypothetical protein N9H93_05365 [Rhizobiaceae bacterium]|nr:hypothetical protein [Rhizobiaceae bacterium]
MSAAAGLITQGWSIDATLWQTVMPFGIAGLLGGGATAYIMQRLLRPADWPKRMALAVFALAVLTVGFAVVWHVVEYRLYFSQWHSPAFTVPWAFQNVFTALGAAYLFASTGLVLFIPWAVIGWLILGHGLATRQSSTVVKPSRVEGTARL